MSTAWNPTQQPESQPSAPYSQPSAAGPYGEPSAAFAQPQQPAAGASGQPSAATPQVAPFDPGQPASQQPWGQPAPGAYPVAPGNAYAPSPLSVAAGYGGAPVAPLAPVDFGRRVKGWLLDRGIPLGIMLLGMIPFFIGYFGMIAQAVNYDSTSHTPPDFSGVLPWMIGGGLLMLVGSIVSLVITIWGRWIVGGRTGQSWGRRWAGTRLVDERTGQPIGVGMTVVRDLAHNLDGMAMDIGYLAPLFTEKKQTFADMVMHTIVVDAKDAPLRDQ